MASPIIKEEKIEVKQGMLKIASEDRSIFTLKRWKERYFVFCQIRKGDNYWLKLFYFKSHSSYKEGNMPIGCIEITTAKVIGMMDQDLYGLGHIIYIETPDKTHWLSASLCDDRSQWLLALRAYKYNDESKLPLSIERTNTWHGTVCNRSPLVERKMSQSTNDPYAERIASSQKLRKNYLVCLKCRGKDVPRDVYEWVRPEHSDIHNKIYGTLSTPGRKNENIYDEIPLQEEENESYSIAKNHIKDEQKYQMKAESDIPIQESSGGDTKGGCMTHFSNECMSMAGRQGEHENERDYAYYRKPLTRPPPKALSVPNIFGAGHKSESPDLKGSPEGILPKNKSLSALMTAKRNRYTPESVLGGPINLQNGSKGNIIAYTSNIELIRNKLYQERNSDTRDVHSSGDEKTSMSLEVTEV